MSLPTIAPMPRAARARAAAIVVAAALLPAASAQPAPKPPAGTENGVYTCTTADGRKLTSDRPIAECVTREQRVLNADGSLRRVEPPTMTPEERAEAEALERRRAAERLAQQDAIRRDRNLMARYRDEASHRRGREAALDSVRTAIRNSEARLAELATERKPLMNEAEFYIGKPLPPKLKQQIDANDAATEAQRSAAATQRAELDRINRLYDIELERLKKLWAGARPGSLGPLASQPAASAPR